ncbi:hypothetical protein TWF225_008996 [Orbilia oligospora]|uniref:Uncharacterized protein n=1 Tax=Orbilia oligospora TaxID=2813651 RepID=A0A7C8K4Y0_ORBOL|nr:hypothetical protein TWF751_002499 [Orbilia oligospora]KAF3175094.1 hypothetical protein TWF225_008996 [Orbilia oligospora]KAF3240325.1 hypothetical protein TWF128_011346 [Orbilia oligospora]KAF3248656.1 hypothetical protein TWF217_009018 [Orbilia oligospora]TGJ68669.1 hypothetical protein EYR41_004762 [Orbilia oligospora]
MLDSSLRSSQPIHHVMLRCSVDPDTIMPSPFLHEEAKHSKRDITRQNSGLPGVYMLQPLKIVPSASCGRRLHLVPPKIDAQKNNAVYSASHL